MAQLDARPPSKTLRGTWDEILAHTNEIPRTSEVELRVYEPEPATDTDRSIALLESWIAQAPTDPDAIREAEEDLREFKRNMNLPRKETGARLPYPEVE
jgi:hypothetical protein